VANEGKKFEAYDYPGDYAKKFIDVGSVGKVRPEGDKLARIRMEKEETRHTVMSGTSRCRQMTTGYKFDVTGGFATGSYLLTEARHDANQSPAYVQMPSARTAYKNSFRAIPSSRVFVPEMRLHPGVRGLQTAFVIDESPSGNTEEIWPDKYGRVRVRFHWDREAKYACWLRVVQPWAGKAWGQQWIPRVGDEVAVTFLEGDPDCPVVMGGIYNSDNMPIFSLPDNKTQSGILTHSSKGGGSSNYNMLRFEDKIGAEEIFTQAEKDQNALIKNNETRTVKNCRTTTIHVNDSRTVETGQDTISVQQGARTVTVKQDITTTSQSASITTTANQAMSDTAQNGPITITASNNSVTISGKTEILLQCGGSTITMTPDGIVLKAGTINLNPS
jgi:type VI secretion system secreted protein VgrG